MLTDPLRSRLSRKSNNTPGSSSRWRSRRLGKGTDFADGPKHADFPTPQYTVLENRPHLRDWEQAVPIRRSAHQQPTPTVVQDPQRLIQNSLNILASIYNPFMTARVAASQYHGASGLPTPPSSPTPWSNVPKIAPDLMRWFVVELLKRSSTCAPVIRAAIHYIDQAAPVIRHTIEESDGDASAADSPLLDPRRVYLAAVILGSKFLLDKTYTNKAWASVSGLDAFEVGRCERALAEALQWKLWYEDPNSTSQ